jgi:predicted CXXCH cytochrome family protein
LKTLIKFFTHFNGCRLLLQNVRLLKLRMRRNKGSREMIKQIKVGLIALVGVVIWGLTPGVVHAAKTHSFACNDCHKAPAAANPRAMGNLCVECHKKSLTTTVARFDVGTASNALAHNPSPGTGSGAETSHFWGGNTTLQAAAGSSHPTTAFYTSRYSISTKRITCTICHDPHGEQGTKLVRAAIGNDLICQQCHGGWFISNIPDTNATLTHPVVADYATFAATKPADYNVAPVNTGSGDVRLVNGGVACTSCHATHYADSSAATVDGISTYNNLTMAKGDGNILRSDGPLRTGATRNGATGTAQLRSNLCQACHKIELHGQGASGDHMIGCLDCHGGHAYNGGTPNAYILNKMTPDAVPTRIDGVNSASAQITFPDYSNGGSTRTKWADDVTGTANGFCEKCHGDVNSAAMVAKAAEHEAGNTNECTACHKHNDPANLYSFNRDASAATCGQCHGFPPYLNVPGDRVAVPANDGGYAVNSSADPNTPYDYVNTTTHEKDETLTGHKVHAGRDLPTSPANTEVSDWYFVGVSGIDNCKVCHGPDASSATGGHRIAPATRPDTFRDVPFDGIAKHGGMTPAYNVDSPWTCSSVYCHTNGAPYDNATRPSRVYTRVNTTPPWVGAGTSYAVGGYGSIHGQTYECASCHGNTAATMDTGVDPMKSNSVAHLAHLGGATTLNMAKTFNCSVCHVQSAASSTALAVNAMDGRVGGKHVNGEIDVDFETGTTLNTLPEALTGSTYTAASGVCSTYCHNVTGAVGAVAADWDLAATDMQCDSCHGGLATDSSGDGGYGPITTGSHTRHILTTGSGPKLACAECHGTNSDAGTHSGHLDGTVTMKPPVNGVNFTTICEECHGYDAEAGEILPVWGSPATTDCATCHAGTQCGAIFNGKSPISLDLARTSGHNRPTSAGAYVQTANPAANQNCSGCHVTDDAGHWDGTSGDDLMLKVDSGFPATYAGSENAFCGNCHGATGTASKKNINTHQSKLCVACHNVHGSSNLQMIWATQAQQVSHDPSTTGKFAADVFFSNVTDFLAGNLNSYDEDDGAVGGAGEANADDLCATCHTAAAGTTHNNADNSTGDHKQGLDCFTCHAAHTDSTDAFKVNAGTACNDCHGFPPATGAHRKGTLITDSELHSNTTSNLDTEDRTDCAWCHTGADQYTYDLTLDQAAVGDRGNHGKGQANRRTVLGTAVGYETTNFSCATACHASGATDGAWSDTTGLNCNACHYYAAVPTSAGNVTASNSEALGALAHNKHFDKSKLCSDCHTVDNGGNSLRGLLTHIIVPDYSGLNDDGLLVQGRAQAAQDEAAVVRAGMTFDDTLNTCSGGIGIGCHASGTPDWDIAIPATSAGCVECHTETNTAAYNPTSGVHDNSPSGPTVTGNAHDGSFDDGSAGTADCVTCHSTSPTGVAADHINGTLNSGTAITIQAIAGYTQAAGTCTTTCHSVGTVWAYKWATSAYNTNGTECANCHGDYASGWNTGVAPHTENPTRGNKHNNTGNLTYPCTDCHAIGSTSGYNWTSKWDPTGVNSNHGDDKITMNQTAINTFVIDTVPTPDRAGCTTSSCHSNDAAHTLTITTTALLTATVAGNEPSILCSSCHGGTAGTNANGYWPDGANAVDNGVEDNSGAHLKHVTALAKSKYGETLAQLLTDNGNGTADAKQKFLCAYCHNTPGADADHGTVGNLPAEVNSMYALWDLTRATSDNGLFTPASGTCDTVDCHYNKTTPTTPTSYVWYSGTISACIMCHLDVTAEAKHTAHTGAATNFGRTIGCADCHEAATSWAGNIAPATGHIGGTYSIAGSVAFTYTSSSCGTNVCHNIGDGATAPVTDPYPWNGGALANCTICHAGTPATGAHAKHVGNTAYVSGSCTDCHSNATTTQITATTHIDGTRNTGGGKSVVFNANGSCTNTCHLSAEAGDWTGGAAAIACSDCHSGSGAAAYIGGDKTSVPGPNYMPQYNMHLTVPTVSGKQHTDTGLATTCATCHSTISGLATHADGTWNVDSGTNSDRGMFAAFTDGLPATCATTCHSAGTAWRYKWSATSGNTDGTQCANCHGTFADGWTTGTVHATDAARGNGAHTDAGTAGFPCTDCHSLGSSNGAYPYAATTNDWKATDAAATTLHGDGFITMNSTGTTWARSVPRSGCSACHEGANGTANAHDFPASALTSQTVAGVAPNVSGCTSCHGGTEYAPDGTAYPDRAGKHAQHVAAIAVKLGGNTEANRNAACDYCHVNPGESGHNTNNAPLDAADVTGIKRITNKSVDTSYTVNGQGTNYVTCSNIDCHFDMPRTPHWYTDDIAPAAVTLTAAAGPRPRTVKVTWNAPGDDDNVADTTPYVYDLRIGTTAAIATDFALTDNYAGNLPAAYKQGFASEAIVENLAVGTTYYFSLKTRDTVGNWSPASAAVSALPTSDTTAPFFGGANKATKGDSSATVYLEWTPAEDHTMPITYKVWRKAASDGALDMNVDTPLLTGVKGHSIQLTSASPDSLLNDTIYNFGVRACDANNNCDTNKQIVSATPTAEPQVTRTNHTYRTNGNLTLVKDGAAGTAVTGAALPLVFTPSANNTYPVTYYVDTFAVYLDITAANAATIRATIGYSTNGTNFTSLGVTKDVAAAKAGDRVYSFKLVDVAGKTINSGERLAIQLSEVTATGVKVNYGSTAYRGDVTVAEKIVNVVPTDPAVNATVSGANVNVTWTASTDTVDGLSDTVHYDLFGSDDNGATYRYLVARDIPAATTSYAWNTQEDGISGAATVAVKLLPGDGYGHYTAATATKTGLAIDNTLDNVAPSAINDLTAKARPKSGSVWLTWTAPGDDEHNNGRAKYYDIRYSTAAITEGNFATATPCVNEPSPDFGGKIQNFEVTGLTPGQSYYFAIKTYDDGSPANASPISTAKAAGSDQTVGGPRCGMCHTTAPSIVESVGNHKLHGFTLNDCTKCHGSTVATYSLDHQDGLMKMGYGPGGPVVGTISTTTITNDTITYTDTSTSKVMYRDTDGYGGFGDGSYATVGDAFDDGTCINFGAMGVGGCHSAAGTDPDGAGALPTYPTPTWDAAATLSCSACHGNPSRTTDSFYNRAFDATTANAGVVPDQIKGAPVVDNRGNYDLADPDEKDRKYIGQHEKHLNYSFRFSKGDSCNLCHSGNYRDVNDLDGKHANGDVDVKLDLTAAGANATWTAGTATTAGSCSNMSPESCHPSASSPKWDSAQNFDCVGCHGMAGTTPSHVTDPDGGVTLANNGWATDPMAGNCTYCHIGGHPLDDVGGTALILANSSQVGINYKSGGIHLKKSIGARLAQATEAELCWQCHDANSISEWGIDTGGNNTSTKPANASDYNYGTVTTSNWTTASWSSPVANFSYKTGNIQSTHSTNESGTGAVTGTGIGTYTETKDTVDKIRCSNCHDVHNLNKAPNDTMTGQPYLRGTWIRNPYPEDGAPWNKAYAVVVTNYGAVPRAGGNEQGGYQIDQNNSFPTAGLSLATSAGLCTLCHGTTVDSMDKTTGESLWIGTNGHSNATLGGTASNAANIFGDGIGGRPIPNAGATDGSANTGDIYNMGLQVLAGINKYGYGYRSLQTGTGKYTPSIVDKSQPFLADFKWGVSVDQSTVDIGYHAFTCSKCHNPHASRLPKLMITNCLDTRHNTWDENKGKTQTFWTSADDKDETTATHNTSQNCHRYDPNDTVGGWNKVTPW